MKKKILFFIESLGGGGAEKVLSTVVKHIDTQKFEVMVCVITEGGRYDEEISSQVCLCSLLKNPNTYHGLGKLWYWLKYHLIYDWLPLKWVYKLFLPHDSDVEIAFVEGFATRLLASSTNKKAKKIAWVHCDLKNQPWTILRGVYGNLEEEISVYKRFHSVLCVSNIVENVMKEHYGLSNTFTIYNPIDEQSIKHLASQKCEWNIDGSNFNVVSVGRLEKVKGFDKLIPIVRDIRDAGIAIHLWILGDGTEKNPLKMLVDELGLEDNVTFTGFLSNPYSLMSKMDLFVCASRAEGFSLVIAEAMILGMPVISMDCAGPRELITNTGTGVLCDSYEEMKSEIYRWAKSIKSRSDMRVVSFDITHVMSQIENVLLS